ncbi:asparagine synthase (glutamine-hydrolyzing) [Halarchaeum solikamskense]|uniref:asparagine synthase-related protein n=1 Tax=Halarchaeum nitratireducens TaxID=489913 RepID=UPI001B3AED69|nr:asparagine synthase-related protein [Halarchaeum solikamskense]MBP2249899.1 asparagine synthase (glutamine-hydrolyzing) [Halarchaeum solikamskense]
MVGLSGVVGAGATETEIDTVPATVDDEVRGTHRADGVAVRTAFHRGASVEQPVTAPDGALIWVWGEVYGVGDGDERERVDPRETARVCAAQSAAHGRSFPDRLDGEFAGVRYDPETGRATLFTDRLGARPLYYAVGDDALAFSTSVQSVPEVDGAAFAFDPDYLAEYLYARRTFGTRTPIAGIDQLAPATTVAYDPAGGGLNERRYWAPRYRPVDRPLSHYVDELAERFAAAVADRTADDRAAGLLLSGGSDSRAVLAAAGEEAGASAVEGRRERADGGGNGEPIRAYHMNDGWNREARIARRIADTGDAPFTLLDRRPSYHETLSERAAPIQEFIGPFNTGHALGFASELAADVDVLLTGLYSDSLFGPWSVPSPEVPLPYGASLPLPITDLPETVEEYAAAHAASQPARDPDYLDAPPLDQLVRENVREGVASIDHHGVDHPDVERLALSEFYYPITNGIGFDLYSALQIAPTRNPFLDRRLVDLHLEIPLRYRLRHDLVALALERLDEELAAIPHPSTRLPLTAPHLAHVVAAPASSLLDKLRGGRDSYRTWGPWQDKDALLRERDFVGDALREADDVVRALPGVDRDAAWETYRRHRAGEIDAGEELYRLLTVAATPLAARLVGDDGE